MSTIIGNHINLGKFNFLHQMDIIIKLEEQLAGNEQPLAVGIKDAIKHKPASLVIKEVKEIIEANEKFMRDLLGTNLCDKIKTFS